MRTLTIILISISISAIGQNCLEKPSNLRTDKILVYLNSFAESTYLINEEFEKTNDAEKVKKRSQDLSLYSHNQYGKSIASDDKYALAVDEKIVNWLNESIVSICEQLDQKNFQIINEATLKDYNSDEFKYILKYKYVMPNGDPLETKMIFYFHDRIDNKDLVSPDNSNTKLFRPFFYFTAEKWYPFYGVLKASGKKTVKTEWLNCLKTL